MQPSAIQGFGISTNVANKNIRRTFVPSIISNGSEISRENVIMFATEGEATPDESTADEEITSEESSEEETSSDDETTSSEEDEVEAIKKTIAELETTLKNKNREINNVEKLGEQYTEAGYARKVAEMESYRRSRSANAADGKVVAKAGVLQNFLPIVDELKSLEEKYQGDEFAQKYSALSSEFNGVLSKMGVQEFTVAEGDKADSRRVTAVEEEHSDSIPKGCVIRAIEGSCGYELEGNVMRMAEAVVSLGPEAEEEAEEEAAEEATSTDSDKEESEE